LLIFIQYILFEDLNFYKFHRFNFDSLLFLDEEEIVGKRFFYKVLL